MITLEYLKNNHDEIHYFGLGFIQIKIGKTNFHFYTDKWGVVEDNIHTHKYSFKSKILKGSLTQFIYKEVKGEEYNKTMCDCKEGTEDQFLKKTNLKEIIKMTLSPETVYEIDCNTIHKVESNFCITKIEKGEYIKEKASIYKPFNMPKDVCPFFKVDKKELWKEVERMINERK